MNILIIACVIIFILIVLSHNYKSNLEQVNKLSKTTLILTSTVIVNDKKSYLVQKDPKERIQTYLHSITQWLQKTNFNIILVENSGYDFNELNDEKEKYKNKFELITFNENTLPEAGNLKNDHSKGTSEIFAINYAFIKSKFRNSSNFIIKITARYYIDELEKYLSGFDLDKFDCLTQYNRDRCEMVGSHIKNFEDIFNPKNISHHDIEEVWKKCTSKYENILICKEFNIENTQRGGIDGKFNTI